MAINYFIGWTTDDLQRALREAQEDLAAGKATIQAGAGDASAQSRIEKSAEARIQLILRALYAIDPETYPLADITPITQTRVTFSFNPVPELDSGNY